jgi:hypothetical protein
MKLAVQFMFVLSTLGLAACGETTPPEPIAQVPEGLHMETLDSTFVAGTYRVGDDAIRFEVINNGVETVRFLDLAGNELMRSEIVGDPKAVAELPANEVKWTMWHYGVAVDTTKTMDVQPEMNRWVESQEAQLVASLWRDVVAQYPTYETGPLNGLFRYGVHLEEALAFDHAGLEDTQEVDCSCYGKCGPGCFSVGSNWYCSKHDCCCRTYGSAACYSWCFVYPKCPAAICY